MWNLKGEKMLTQLKIDENYNDDEAYMQHDAHIKAYRSKLMGIKVVICNSRGVPIYDAIAPMSEYLPNSSHNI